MPCLYGFYCTDYVLKQEEEIALVCFSSVLSIFRASQLTKYEISHHPSVRFSSNYKLKFMGPWMGTYKTMEEKDCLSRALAQKLNIIGKKYYIRSLF